MEMAILALVVLALGWFVLSPLGTSDEEVNEDPALAALEARRDAKYREIRDARTDRDLGKIDQAQFEALDAELRAQAVEILDEIEAHQAGENSR